MINQTDRRLFLTWWTIIIGVRFSSFDLAKNSHQDFPFISLSSRRSCLPAKLLKKKKKIRAILPKLLPAPHQIRATRPIVESHPRIKRNRLTGHERDRHPAPMNHFQFNRNSFEIRAFRRRTEPP